MKGIGIYNLNFYDVTSAMQKCIRRGNTLEAMFFADQIILGQMTAYLSKRLKVIASEDVGLGNNTALMLVANLTRGSSRKEFLKAVYLMSESPQKSRIVDDAKLWALKFDLDGYEKTKNILNMTEELSKGNIREALQYCKPIVESKRFASIYPSLKAYIRQTPRYAKYSFELEKMMYVVDSLNTATNPCHLFPMIHLVLFLCLPDEAIHFVEINEEGFEEALYQMDRVSYEIPDYAYDVHTMKGKKMGRLYRYFIEEGRKINNEIQIPEGEWFKEKAHDYLRAYEDKLVTEDGYKKGLQVEQKRLF